MSVSGASAGQPGASPMARFGQVLSTLPPEAIPDFVQHFKPIADSAQQKEDFSKAIQMTEGLLTPDQQKGMQLAQTLASAGAPKEMWESFLPMGQLQLAAKQEEIKNAGSARASDRVATKELMRRGLLPPSGLSDYTVNGAAKMFYDYVAREREQVRAASLEQNKQAAVKLIDSLEGSALEIAQANPDWSGPKIKEALKTMSGYSSLPDGVVAKAALEAPKKAAALTAPANETQAKLRVVYGPGRAALATVNAMDSKGQALGIAARLAQTDELKAAAGLGGAGLAAGGVLGAAAGAGIGYLGAPLVRGAGRAVMSTDQQRLWTAAQNLAASIYRPESGAAVTQEEVRQTIERYIPLNTDKPGTRQLKRQLRSELDRTLASVSGLPQQLAKPILDQFLSQQEQRLLDGTSW